MNWMYKEDFLAHYGVKGMKWGKRKAKYEYRKDKIMDTINDAREDSSYIRTKASEEKKMKDTALALIRRIQLNERINKKSINDLNTMNDSNNGRTYTITARPNSVLKFDSSNPDIKIDSYPSEGKSVMRITDSKKRVIEITVTHKAEDAYTQALSGLSYNQNARGYSRYYTK